MHMRRRCTAAVLVMDFLRSAAMRGPAVRVPVHAGHGEVTHRGVSQVGIRQSGSPARNANTQLRHQRARGFPRPRPRAVPSSGKWDMSRAVLRWNCAKAIANIDDLAILIWALKVIDKLSQIDDI